jgi:stage II sporulation protein M
MGNIKIIGFLSRHFQENFWLYVLSLLCLSTGIVLGIYTVKYMSEVQKGDLVNYFGSFTDYLKSYQINRQYVLFETLKNNVPVMILLWVLGFTIIGIPVILIIDIFKGFTLGFTITFIMNGIGIKGIWIALAGIIPQNLIYLPCIILASVFSMELSLYKLRNRLNKPMAKSIGNQYAAYTATFLILLLIMFLGFLIEAYFTTNILKVILSN